ncbi:MAG: YigZ family protein [Paludibacter sp.]|nr:YigZ family protein [Paludibacter sp.]MDD4198964.1 YigZ family protein [Paludibacter sp.]
MTETYLTIQKQINGIYKEKGSKFLSFALPVKDVEEVKMQLAAYKKEYHDARHVCYAYMLGAEREDYRVNDDGEPSGTAGRPILGQINSRGLTNVLVVVVRYFGGVLLGTGGLITAYKAAASDALEQAEIVEKTVDCNIEVFFEYPSMKIVMSAIKECQAQIIRQDFNESCCIKMTVPLANKSTLCDKLEKVVKRIIIS